MNNRTSVSIVLLTLTSLFCAELRIGAGQELAVVIPDIARVGDFGTWKIAVTIGERGISVGGVIKIQFPNGWYSSPWPQGKLKNIQFIDSRRNHYVAVSLTRPKSKAKLSIIREGIDGQHDRYGRTFMISIRERPLLAGDKVTLTYANTTAPTTSELQWVVVAVDANGNGKFKLISQLPALHLLPEKPAELRVIAESQAGVGKPAQSTVVALDKFLNATGLYRGTVQFTSDDSTASLPSDYAFSKEDNGRKTFSVVFNSSGIHRVKVSEDSYLAPHGIPSNPIDVGEISRLNTYWGDLHSHSNHSKDGTGEAETAFSYARDVAVLDFYTLTDHGAGDWLPDGKYWKGLTPEEWEENKELVKGYNEPGRFITFLACEWSGASPYGHHNIFYRNLEGSPFGRDQYLKVEDVWGLLKSGDAFTVPHHTGLTWLVESGPFVDFVDWRLSRNDSFRTAIEIYSLWGSSEYFGNSMSYDHYDSRGIITSYDGPSYARNGWAFGHYIGSVGGSDDHNSHPGQIHGGLTAVLASELKRDAIFDAILQRHTYATTGERILLDFKINGRIIGDRLRLQADELPKIQLHAVGTDKIELVEVMKYDGKKWMASQRVEPRSKQVKISFTDYELTESALYYVRLKQWNPVHNREVWAWSSPIWVTKESAPWWNSSK